MVNSSLYNDCYCNVWMGKNESVMCLKKGVNIYDNPYIELSYTTLVGNDWLLDVNNSILAEEAERIKTSLEGL